MLMRVYIVVYFYTGAKMSADVVRVEHISSLFLWKWISCFLILLSYFSFCKLKFSLKFLICKMTIILSLRKIPLGPILILNRFWTSQYVFRKTKYLLEFCIHMHTQLQWTITHNFNRPWPGSVKEGFLELFRTLLILSLQTDHIFRHMSHETSNNNNDYRILVKLRYNYMYMT